MLGVGPVYEFGNPKVVATVYHKAVELVGYADGDAEVDALDAWEVGGNVHAAYRSRGLVPDVEAGLEPSLMARPLTTYTLARIGTLI